MNAEILSFYSDKDSENISECEKVISSFSLHIGIENTYHTQIKSEKQPLLNALKSALGRNQIIFLCGDIKVSCEILCNLMHSSGKKNPEYSAFTKSPLDNQEVLFPENSIVYIERESKEAAFISKIAGKTVFALPPFSSAVSNIIDEYFIPYFSKEFRRSLSRVQINLFGISPQETTSGLEIVKRKYKVNSSLSSSGSVTGITVYSCAKTFSESDNACSNAIAELKSIFGHNIFEMGSRTLAEVTVDLLRKTALTVATAESCTGGFLSETITSVSGASQVLELGVCAYSNRVKQETLGIDSQVLTAFGAISKETAVALAERVKKISGAGLGVGITGVAGPSSCEGKPVGTVYVALTDGNKHWIRSLNMSPDSTRDQIREFAVATALDLIRRYCIVSPQTLSGFCTTDKLTVLDQQPSIYFAPAKTENEDISTPSNSFTYNENTNFFTDNEEISDSVEIQANDSENDEGYLLQNDTEEYVPFKKKDKKSCIIFPLFKKIVSFYKNGNNLQRAVKITFTVFAALLLVFCIFMAVFFGNIFRDRSQLKNAQESFSANASLCFDTLKNNNGDFKGWLYINNSQINNPVYQSLDNSYYVNHNMNKQKSRYGALYFDYRSNLTKSKNLVIYGQNLDDGSMFGSLSDYLSISNITKNQNITLTLSDGTAKYKVFAVLIMNSKAQDDNGYLFEFTKSEFKDSTSFNSWLNELNERNLYICNADITYEDSLLTLVTTNNAFENARLVVMAKKVNENEKDHTFTVNPSPRYPQKWFDERKLDATWSSPKKIQSSSQTDSSEESSSEESGEGTSPQTPASTGTGQNRPTNPDNQGTTTQNTGGGNQTEDNNNSDNQSSENPQNPSQDENSSTDENPSQDENSSADENPSQDESENQDNSSGQEPQE